MPILMFLFCNSTYAEEWRISKNENGIIKSVYFSQTDSIHDTPTTARDFFTQFLYIDNDENVFKKELTKTSIRGMSFERYKQYYKGVNVEGGYYSFRFRDNIMIVAKGNYVNTNQIDPVPEISDNAAVKQFTSFLNVKLDNTIIPYISLIIKELSFSGKKQAFLVYKIELYNPESSKIEIGYIDAHTGELLHHEQKSFCSSATATFHTYYNNTVTGNTDSYQGEYRLFDSTRGNGIHTYNDLNGYDIYDFYNAYEFKDADNNWTVSEMGNNRMALDVHWTLGRIYDVLKYTYEHNSYDGLNGVINSYITTSSISTQFVPNPTRFYFNLGNSTETKPMASIDVIAHEFGHAILYNTCDWTFSGALHEGFADIWGILFEHQINPNKDIWKSGEDIMIGYSCDRNFAIPSDPYAHLQISDTYGINPHNSIDPHVIGGILPRWFYLLVNGGSDINGIGNNYMVCPMGYDLVEQLVVYTALNPSYIEDCTSFSDVRDAFIEAAEDLGYYFLAKQVANAWYAVGVGSNGNSVPISGPTDIYNSATFMVQGLPTGYTVSWNLAGINASNFALNSNSSSIGQCTITRLTGTEFSGSSYLTLNAIVMYNGTPIDTLSKQLIAPYIEGPTIPCGITVYSVTPVLQNTSVSWSADGQYLDYYNAPGVQPLADPNEYVINPPSNVDVCGTLTATVTAGNNVLGVLDKFVDTTGGFSGTWYQQATLNDTINSTPKPFLHNSLLEFVPNRTVYLSSDHFNNATISHSESGVFLSGWSNSNGVISFNPVQPINYTGSSTIIIEGTAQSGCKKFRLRLFSPPSLIDDPILLSKNPDGSTYEFSISEDVRSRQEGSSESNNPLEWRLTIIKIDSANRIFDEMVRASSISVNVSGWPRGIYIAIAQIKDQYYSLKFSVGE